MNIEQIDSRVGLKESQIYRIIASGPTFLSRYTALYHMILLWKHSGLALFKNYQRALLGHHYNFIYM